MFDTENPLLLKLAEQEGMDVMDMLEEAVMDSIVPAICTTCEGGTEMEPDQDRGWCESCGTNTVKSCLILAGVI